MITAYLVGDREVIAKFNHMPSGVHRRLLQAITKLAIELDRTVKRKLSGEVLHVRSGVLRSSTNYKITDSATEVTATEGTNVKYAKFQELGVPHSWEIRPKTAKALAFSWNVPGHILTRDPAFFRSVIHPPLPARSFLASALRELEPKIRSDIAAAVDQAIHE
jgi:phage gpG-like protein